MGVDLDGRRLVIVGASAGIGRALAREALHAGADAVLVGRRRERLDELVAEAGRGHPVVADLTDPAACVALADAARDALGTIDALVFCAGASGLHRVRDVRYEDWRAVFDVNVIGPSVVVGSALPHIAPGGLVAFLSSESVGRPRPGLTPYSASKAALEEAIRGWRVEHPELRFAALCVGATNGTEFARDFDMALAAELFPTWVAHGHMAAAMMPVDEVARALLETVATALAHPSVDVQGVTLRPPGPLMEGSGDSLLARIDDGQSEAGSER